VFKNVASQKFVVFAFDATTNLPKTGDAANITAYVSKDFGAVTVLADTTATEMDATNAKGYYLFDAAQAETNADLLLVSAKSATANIVVVGAPAAIFTFPTTGILAPATAGRTLVVDAAGLADANTVKVGPSGSGTAQTARDVGGNVDVAVSTRSTYAGADTSGTTTLLGRITGTLPLASDYTSARATKLDNLDATVSSRMATFTLPTNFSALSISAGGLVDILQTSADKVWSSTSRTLSSFGTLVSDIWAQLLTAITTAGSIGKLLKDNVDATTSSRLATSGYTAPDNTSITAIKTQTDKFVFTIANRVDCQVKGADVSSIDAAALATDAVTEITNAISAIAIDGSYTLQQVLEIIVGAVAGKLSGAGTGTIVIRNIADTKNLITTTVDATGRLTVTLNA
jgi:hypothetical protein